MFGTDRIRSVLEGIAFSTRRALSGWDAEQQRAQTACRVIAALLPGVEAEQAKA